MRKSLQTLLLVGICGLGRCGFAWSHDLPPLGKLPDFGRGWEFHEADKSKLPSFPIHWIVFRHNVSGDYLSIASFPPDRLPQPDMIYHSDTAHECFPDGLPAWNRVKLENHDMLIHSISNEVVQLGFRDSRSLKPFKTEVLKYCFVTETGVGKNLMSHGRCWSSDTGVVYIQHTSATPITEEFLEKTTRTLIERQE